MKRVHTGTGGLMKGGIWVVEDEILRCAQYCSNKVCAI